jgi:hypothetical protein
MEARAAAARGPRYAALLRRGEALDAPGFAEWLEANPESQLQEGETDVQARTYYGLRRSLTPDRRAALSRRGRALAAPGFAAWLEANPESQLQEGETDLQARMIYNLAAEDRRAALVRRGAQIMQKWSGRRDGQAFNAWLAANPECELQEGETDERAVALSRQEMAQRLSMRYNDATRSARYDLAQRVEDRARAAARSAVLVARRAELHALSDRCDREDEVWRAEGRRLQEVRTAMRLLDNVHDAAPPPFFDPPAI